MAEWFEPTRYGLGSGLPIAWQGWAVLGAFTALIITSILLLADSLLALFSIVLPATILFMVICARTTRGGWRWRWGEKD